MRPFFKSMPIVFQIGFASLFIIIPNLFLYFFNDPLEAPKRSFLAVTVFVLLIFWSLPLKGKKLYFNFSLLDLAVIVYALSYLLSTLFSIDFLTSLFGISGGQNGNNNTLIFIVICALLYGLGKYAYQSRLITLDQIIWSVIGGGIIAWLGYFYIAGALPALVYNPFLVLFQNPPLAMPSTQTHQIILAFYLSGIFWISLFYGLQNIRNKQGKICLVLSCLFFWLILLTQVRGAIILLLAEVVILGCIFGKTIFLHSGRWIKIWGIMTLLVILLMFMARSDLHNRFSSLLNQSAAQSSLVIRLAEWKGAIQVLQERPILGYGPNTTQFTYPKYKPAFINQNEQEWQMHTFDIRNQYLNIAANVGLAGFISFLVIISLVFILIMKRRKNREVFITFTIWLAVSLSFLLYHQTVALAILFWAFLGIISAQLKERIYFHTELPYFTKFVVIGVAVVGIMGAVAVQVSNLYYSQAMLLAEEYVRLNQNTAYFKASILFEKARQINPLNFQAGYDQGRLGLEILKGSGANKEQVNNSEQVFQLSQKALKDGLKLSPANFETENILSLVYFYKAQANPFHKYLIKDSIALAEKAIEKDPLQPQKWDIYGQFLLFNSQLNEAELAFRKAISLKNNYQAFYYHLNEALRQQGKPEEEMVKLQP